MGSGLATAVALLLLVFSVGRVAGECGSKTTIASCCEIESPVVQSKFTVASPDAVYKITKFCGQCDMTVEGYCKDGWLVVQRRQDGSVDFDRDWLDYETGFGSLTGEFWYGLQSLHCLTSQGRWELRVDVTLTNGSKLSFNYTTFKVGPPEDNYRLGISGYQPNGIEDPFRPATSNQHLRGMKFSTRDRDNDRYSGGNCATGYGGKPGGWWFNKCSAILPNIQPNHSSHGIRVNGTWHTFSFIELKIRPLNCVV